MEKTVSKKQYAILIAIIVGIVVFDQFTKHIAETQLQYLPSGSAEFVPGLIRFEYARNTGAAMSLLSGIPNSTIVLAVLSAVMAAAVIVAMFKFRSVRSWLFRLSLAFIAGGAVGNLIDRALRGYVVDMMLFETKYFPFIFNVADSFVVVGAVMLAIFYNTVLGRAQKNGGQRR
jgi:signal peptidase II